MHLLLWLAMPLLPAFAAFGPCGENEYYLCCAEQPQKVTQVAELGCYERTLSLSSSLLHQLWSLSSKRNSIGNDTGWYFCVSASWLQLPPTITVPVQIRKSAARGTPESWVASIYISYQHHPPSFLVSNSLLRSLSLCLATVGPPSLRLMYVHTCVCLCSCHILLNQSKRTS